VVAGAVFGIIFGFLLFAWHGPNNPLPSEIKDQVSYKVIYPGTGKINKASYKYQSVDNTLVFNVNDGDNQVVFTQQPAPSNLGSDGQVYYPALGLHPYAQFKSSLGQVALAKFWQSGTLKPIGQSAVLASKGTLLIAHSEKDMSNSQWKAMFDSLKITK
jgi:hypothetical protein